MTYTLTAHPNTIVRDEDGAFIPTDPDNVDYQDYLAWVEAGNTPNPHVPPTPTKRQEADAWLAGGLTIQFTSSTTLSSTYPVVEPHNHNINSIATSLAYDGNTFPNGGNAIEIIDMAGEVHLFDKNGFKLLQRAIRDFSHNTNLYAMGVTTSLPSNSVSKSVEELEEKHNGASTSKTPDHHPTEAPGKHRTGHSPAPKRG